MKSRWVLLIGVIAALLSLGGALVSAQTLNGDAVAILIVDVFEPAASDENELPLVPLAELEGEDCALDLQGLDGKVIGGGSGNAVVSSALTPLALPHGQLVTMHLTSLLSAAFNPVGPASVLTSNDSTVWATAHGDILVVPVDTQQYSVPAIVAGIGDTILALNDMGVTRFVINMSFGVIPCGDIPTISIDDYFRQLENWNVTCDTPEAPLSRLACDILPSLADIDSEETGGRLISYDSFQSLIALRAEGGALGEAFALLDRAVMTAKTAAVLAGTDYDDPVNLAPFNQLLTDLTLSGNEIIQIASAGNETLNYPYYPALHPDVLAVSADYSAAACPAGPEPDLIAYLRGLGLDDPSLQGVAEGLLRPTSNAGEVMTDGTTLIAPADYLITPSSPLVDTLGCLNGTSFAAPRVSLLAALHLLQGNGVVCSGAFMSSPPLAHAPFDNLTIAQAAQGYCAAFPLTP